MMLFTSTDGLFMEREEGCGLGGATLTWRQGARHWQRVAGSESCWSFIYYVSRNLITNFEKEMPTQRRFSILQAENFGWQCRV